MAENSASLRHSGAQTLALHGLRSKIFKWPIKMETLPVTVHFPAAAGGAGVCCSGGRVTITSLGLA